MGMLKLTPSAREINEDTNPNSKSQEVIKPIEDYSEGVWERIVDFFSSIFGSYDADLDYETKRQLKLARIKLKKLKFEVYNYKKEKVTSKFGNLLFEIYRHTYPYKSFLDIYHKNKVRESLKLFFIENNLSAQQKELLTFFTEENIAKLLETKSPDDTDKILNDRFVKYQKTFSKETIGQINAQYNALLSFADLVNYDLYPFVRKFAPNMSEIPASENLNFRDVSAHLVLDDLKSLADYLYSLDFTINYKDVLSLYNEYKGFEQPTDKALNRFLAFLQKFVQDNYLVYMIKLIERNPAYLPSSKYRHTENVVSSYFQIVSGEIRKTREKLTENIRKNKMDSVLIKLFGTADINVLKNYNHSFNSQLAKNEVNEFRFIEPLNYVKFFIMEKYNHYIREMTNTIVVEGQFVTNTGAQEMSTYYHNLNDAMKDILDLDETLSEGNIHGSKIRSYMHALGRETRARENLNEYVEGINNKVRDILQRSVRAIDGLYKSYHAINNDIKNKTKDYLINFKTLKSLDLKEFPNMVANAEKDLYYMNHLLKFVYVPDK